MSYRVGVGDGMRRLGFEPCEPAIICDGCGLAHSIVSARRPVPPEWFLDGKAPRGWARYDDGGRRRDLCPRCRRETK